MHRCRFWIELVLEFCLEGLHGSNKPPDVRNCSLLLKFATAQLVGVNFIKKNKIVEMPPSGSLDVSTSMRAHAWVQRFVAESFCIPAA